MIVLIKDELALSEVKEEIIVGSLNFVAALYVLLMVVMVRARARARLGVRVRVPSKHFDADIL